MLLGGTARFSLRVCAYCTSWEIRGQIDCKLCPCYQTAGDAEMRSCADTSYLSSVAQELAVLCTNSMSPSCSLPMYEPALTSTVYRFFTATVLLLLRAYAVCNRSRLVLVLGTVIILARCAHEIYVSPSLDLHSYYSQKLKPTHET